MILPKPKTDDDGNIIFEEDGEDGEDVDFFNHIVVADDDNEGIVDDGNEVRDEDLPRLIVDSSTTAIVTPP